MRLHYRLYIVQINDCALERGLHKIGARISVGTSCVYSIEFVWPCGESIALSPSPSFLKKTNTALPEISLGQSLLVPSLVHTRGGGEALRC